MKAERQGRSMSVHSLQPILSCAYHFKLRRGFRLLGIVDRERPIRRKINRPVHDPDADALALLDCIERAWACPCRDCIGPIDATEYETRKALWYLRRHLRSAP